jgi:hypothetical protein
VTSDLLEQRGGGSSSPPRPLQHRAQTSLGSRRPARDGSRPPSPSRPASYDESLDNVKLSTYLGDACSPRVRQLRRLPSTLTCGGLCEEMRHRGRRQGEESEAGGSQQPRVVQEGMHDDCWRQFCFARQILLFPFFIRDANEDPCWRQSNKSRAKIQLLLDLQNPDPVKPPGPPGLTTCATCRSSRSHISLIWTSNWTFCIWILIYSMRATQWRSPNYLLRTLCMAV